MSESPETPFSNVEINNENKEDEDLFASAVQVLHLLFFMYVDNF